MVRYAEEPIDVIKRPGWVIWVSWIASTLVALVLTLGPMDAYLSNLGDYSYYSFSGDNGIGPLLIFACGLLFVVAPSVGIAQGILLRFLLGFKHWILWTVGTTLGIIVAVIASSLDPEGCSWLLSLIFGVMIGGLAQTSLLARYWRRAAWWLVATLTGCAACLLSVWATRTFLSTNVSFVLPYYPIDSALYWLVSLAVGVVVYGVITGGALVWIVWENDETGYARK